jgi:hypothetical protein
VTVEYNTLEYDGTLLDTFLDLVNDEPLWDMPARCWKLADWSADRKLYGTCGFYYTKKLVFESNAVPILDSGKFATYNPVVAQWIVTGPDGRKWLPNWDKYVIDRSMLVLNGKWVDDPATLAKARWQNLPVGGNPPDYRQPSHYITAVDRKHQPTRLTLSRTSRGNPVIVTDLAAPDKDANWIRLQRFNEGNLFELGIPATID